MTEKINIRLGVLKSIKRNTYMAIVAVPIP